MAGTSKAKSISKAKAWTLRLTVLGCLVAGSIGGPSTLAAQEAEIVNLWIPNAGVHVAFESVSTTREFLLASDLKTEKGSLLVIAVAADSAGAKSGLRVGDIIPRTEKGFFELINRQDGTVHFRVLRAGRSIKTTIAIRKHDLATAKFPPTPGGGGSKLQVAAFGKARFRTITAALVSARRGDTIVVGPGIYRESLILRSGISIHGSGVAQINAQEPLQMIGVRDIDVTGMEMIPTLSKDRNGKEIFRAGAYIFASEHVRFSNAKFTQAKGEALIASKSTAVSIADSQFATPGPANAVLATQSTAAISDTRFDGFNTTITAYDKAEISIRKCLIEDTTLAISSNVGTRVHAHGNMIYGRGLDSNATAINTNGGWVEIKDNTIRGFNRGINLINGDSSITGNAVAGNNFGLTVYSGSSRISHNTIYSNRQDGILISSATKPRAGDELVEIIHNSFFDNGVGVVVAGRKQIVVSDNLFQGNYSGIRTSKSAVIVSGNTAVNQYYSFVVGDGSTAKIDRNIVAFNGFGILIDARAQASLSYNDVYANLARKEFPLLDSNYVRLDRLPTEKGDSLLIRVFPAYDLKGESDISLPPKFVQDGEDYRLNPTGRLARFLGNGQRIGAFDVAVFKPALDQASNNVTVTEPSLLREVRDRLYELNFDPGGIDGPFDDAGRTAIRDFEAANKLAQTGAPTQGLLRRLREATELKPWGAIAFSVSQEKWGMSWSHSSRKEAVLIARKRCGDPSVCKAEVSFFGRDCGAFAYSDGVWSLAARDQIQKARAAALIDCQKRNDSCTIIATVCADGSNNFMVGK